MSHLPHDLPHDVSRCAGVMEIGPHAETCPFRDRCSRYLAWAHWDKRQGLPDYKGIAVMMAVHDCTHGIWHTEEQDHAGPWRQGPPTRRRSSND